ncbi:glycoside hydrolase family 66 protein [Cohnella sp. WQ 127256]|uniref:glycoside hydrolase family 66 protein n=1 Tax=Cohnella sp. WQ 127256 TaxID=2938790 RepID=UPI00211928F5|nr:glycoside hydrolase family 66 protein [Cohnella sp. WQ 127256]
MNDTTCQIKDIYPLKAQYRSGEMVKIAFELQNDSEYDQRIQICCTIRELATEVDRQELTVELGSMSSQTLQLTVGPFNTPFKGYGVDAELLLDQQSIHCLSSSFDVVSDWRKATRYGFLSDYDASEAGDHEDVKWMAKLHLNMVQFYDWMYRHDELVSDDEEYIDLMGRAVSRTVVEEKIAYCHEYGMKAIAYGAIYAASKAFADQHPDWRLYTSADEPFDFIGIFNIMNTSPDSPWSLHIINEYKQAVEKLDFDGIHMDTYGFPKTGWSSVNGASRLERLEEHFPLLINATRSELSQVKEDVCLIFNNVGNWPVDTVARASQDAIYVEVWKPYERYSHLREIISWSKHLSGGKNVILAAYLKPFREAGALGVEGAQHAFRLLNAVVTAHGAYHLLHGENGGVLTQGYYVDHSTISTAFRRTVRDYCDFGVRYGHITIDRKLRDVSMTHTAGDNLEYEFHSFETSTYGEAGKVWTIIQEHPQRKLIHFVNLTGVKDDYWNEGKELPEPVEGRLVTIAVDQQISSILLASPDVDGGRPKELNYRMDTTVRGRTALVQLPILQFWDLLIIQFE